MIQVVLIDEHVLFREGLAITIERSGEFRVVGQCASLHDAIPLLSGHRLLLAIADVRAFQAVGAVGVRMLTCGNRALRIVVFGADIDQPWPVEEVLAAVHGSLSRRQSPASILETLKAVARSPAPAHSEASFPEPSPAGTTAAAFPPLSTRQNQVLRLIAQGKSSKEIAALLDLSPETIRTYRRDLMRKLGLTNQAQVTRFALVHGLADPRNAKETANS